MAFKLREYQKNDLDSVLSCWENASKLAHPFLTEAFLESERYNIPNLYLPNADTWVVESRAKVIGFIALIGNEVGAIFVESEFHGAGAGRLLMDKARQLHGNLAVEVFKANSLGRRFYSNYGFELESEKTYEPTGNALLRLKFTDGQ